MVMKTDQFISLQKFKDQTSQPLYSYSSQFVWIVIAAVSIQALTRLTPTGNFICGLSLSGPVDKTQLYYYFIGHDMS